jgi:hypothetical protein
MASSIDCVEKSKKNPVLDKVHPVPGDDAIAN